jgi:AcrR family transcriptional regulator
MSMEPLTPDRRREMTRRHLLDAAAIVFARDGFHGASLDDVAATAGFTKGAVYSNFKSKDDLFLAVLEDHMNREHEAFARELEGGPRPSAEQVPRLAEIVRNNVWDDDVTALFLEFVLYARRNPEARAKLAALGRQSREFTERLVNREYARLSPEAQLAVPALALISTALFEGLSIERLIDPFAVTRETLDTALEFMYAALGVPDGLEGSFDDSPFGERIVKARRERPSTTSDEPASGHHPEAGSSDG